MESLASVRSVEEEAGEGITFVNGVRGRKVLVFDGHIFYFHSTVKQSTYFKCSQKQKGCTASITVKNFNKGDCSFESFVVMRREHFNHEEEVARKREKSSTSHDRVPKAGNSEETSELFRNRKHVCLFCLSTLPAGYLEVTSLENVIPSGQVLTIPLNDPVRNSQSFDLLCRLLQVNRSRKREECGFDQSKALPLCFKCQNVYQEVVQIHQKIRELEVKLNKLMRVIRGVIGKSEDEEEPTHLNLLGLDAFRKEVKLGESKFHRYGTPTPGWVGSPSSQQSVDVKQEILDDEEPVTKFIDNLWPADEASNHDVPTSPHSLDEYKITSRNDNTGVPTAPDSGKLLSPDSRSRSTRLTAQVKKEKDSMDEYSPSSEEDNEDNYSAYDQSDNDSDYEAKRRLPPRHRALLSRAPSNSLSRYRKRHSASTSISTSHQLKKVNTCHICSYRVMGHKAFWNHYKVEHPDERRYSCKYCKKHYIRLRDVIVHQRTHTGEKPFTCHSCPLAYVSRSLLRLHIIRCHTETVFPCSHCDKEFPSKTILSNHLTAVHGETPKSQLYKKSKRPIKTMTCHLCDAKILGAGPFLQHYKDLHPDEKRFTCKFCGRHFPYIRRVLFHQRTHTGEKPVSCEECDKSFINAAGLRYHRATAHATDRDKIYGCPLCPKRYSLKASLTGHMYSHREYFVVCKTCGKVFRTHCSFHKHNRLFHDGKAECTEPVTNPSKESLDSLGISAGIKCRRKCHVCMAPIPGKIFIQKHFDECHPDHPGDFKTCRCGQQFGSYKEVWKHAIRKHADDHEKPYQCDKCPYSCLTSTELKSHSNTHIPVEERQKTHICDICGLGCASQSTLAQHMRKHQQGSQTKYVCELCGKSYVEKRGLHQHKKTNHWKILPHKCHFDGCGKAFPLRSILLRHLNVHTGENSYKCEDCGKNFHYANSLARHMREVHETGGEEGQTPRKRKGRKSLATGGGKVGGEGVSEGPVASTFSGGGFSEDQGYGIPMDYSHTNYRHQQMGGFLEGFGTVASTGAAVVGQHEMKLEHD